MTLDRDSQYRFVRIEGFGPVAAIRDWAAARIGALPGSSAYTELDSFFSGDSFQRHGGTMARGRITTPQLFADDKKKSPLGAFVVEELIPLSAVLVGETDQAEMRDINTSTVRSERSRAYGRSLLLQAVAGPAFNFHDRARPPSTCGSSSDRPSRHRSRRPGRPDSAGRHPEVGRTGEGPKDRPLPGREVGAGAPVR